MMKFTGNWYDGETSVRTSAVCMLDDDGNIRIEHGKTSELIYVLHSKRIKISSRLADTSRYLLFPGGEKFETKNNDAVDGLAEKIGYTDKMKLVHHLENRLVYIFAALLISELKEYLYSRSGSSTMDLVNWGLSSFCRMGTFFSVLSSKNLISKS